MPADSFAEKAKNDEKDPKAAANAGSINSMQATDKNGKTNVKARRDQKWYSWGCQSTQGGRAALHSEFIRIPFHVLQLTFITKGTKGMPLKDEKPRFVVGKFG